MSREIERKFIVDEYPAIGIHRNSIHYCETNIEQGYFRDGLTRIRITDYGIYGENPQAFLTIKSKRDGISRYEFEYEVPVEDGYHMMELFCEDVVQKTRYKFKEEGKIWEVDIFKEDNDGLILAEVELESEDEEITFPYFIGKEVTDDDRYYNKNLAKNPYKKWKRLYTSYFNSTTFEYKDAVSIAGKSPAYYSGAEYKTLAPKFWFFEKYKRDGDKEFYTKQYYEEVLNKLDPEEVYNDLGQDAVLLCWERPGEFCHRHIVAEWLNNALDIEVKEIGGS